MFDRKNVFSIRVPLVLMLLMLAVSGSLRAEPFGELLPYWNVSSESNISQVDHSSWQKLLNSRLISTHFSGVNRFDYGNITVQEKALLSSYLSDMQGLDPRELNSKEQMAYWINLYNALTVRLIIDNYPVESIKDLGESFFSIGPWDDKVVSITGQLLSLNDIEHGILRPIFRDNRIHYAVNCASVGCPNLSASVFMPENLNEQLDNAARHFINHPRGIALSQNVLQVSSIFHWYKDDFGGTDSELIKHLEKYAEPVLSRKLQNFDGDIEYDYNWSLNRI